MILLDNDYIDSKPCEYSQHVNEKYVFLNKCYKQLFSILIRIDTLLCSISLSNFVMQSNLSE